MRENTALKLDIGETPAESEIERLANHLAAVAPELSQEQRDRLRSLLAHTDGRPTRSLNGGSVTFLNDGKSRKTEERSLTSIGRGFCPHCRRWFAIRLDGTIYAHAVPEGGARCLGSKTKPEQEQRGSAA